jgi:hypothetical protein
MAERPRHLRLPKIVKTYTAEDFKAWGAQGGSKSKRVLTAAQAKEMVAARELKRRKTKRVTRRANIVVSTNIVTTIERIP